MGHKKRKFFVKVVLRSIVVMMLLSGLLNVFIAILFPIMDPQNEHEKIIANLIGIGVLGFSVFVGIFDGRRTWKKGKDLIEDEIETLL